MVKKKDRENHQEVGSSVFSFRCLGPCERLRVPVQIQPQALRLESVLRDLESWAMCRPE